MDRYSDLMTLCFFLDFFAGFLGVCGYACHGVSGSQTDNETAEQ